MHEEALACELAAHFYLELGDTGRSLEYFLMAHERYHEWVSWFSLYLCPALFSPVITHFFSDKYYILVTQGACGKSNSIFEFVDAALRPTTMAGFSNQA